VNPNRLADRPDMVLIARDFAEAINRRDLERAEVCANVFFDTAHGSFAFFDEDDGRCGAMTRKGERCRFRVPPGSPLCDLHADVARRFDERRRATEDR